ncbi:hypothetical protein [uncultured Enterococcus sp.]|uniref:hypothetical protein n=1 Tax=uncultured Enterococcus sp. TaxID=167972 RepID=UPI00258D7982|nr:hypothetical protein [uncultured Enterococcus sp.]
MREEIKQADVIVVKVGTSLLVSPETGIIETAIEQLSNVLTELMAMGKNLFWSLRVLWGSVLHSWEMFRSRRLPLLDKGY